MEKSLESLLEELLALTVNESDTEAGHNCTFSQQPVTSRGVHSTGADVGDCSQTTNSTYQLKFPELSTDTFAHMFFTYFTPGIMFVGLCGNVLSLIVFLSKKMRCLSASIYLASLSISDLLALVFYVFTEWIKRGLPSLPGHVTSPFLERDGTCQILLYFQYISRFLSSWIVVCFTVERYIGVCHPLKRRDLCSTSTSYRVILGLIVTASMLCAYKPILSSAQNIGRYGAQVCTSTLEFQRLSFILDIVFAVAITAIPFIIITILNVLIIRRLRIRNKRRKQIKIVTEESVIRYEFTMILIAISVCFIAFNMPYFTVWCVVYWSFKFVLGTNAPYIYNTRTEYLKNVLLVSRTIFYLNYCVNFFLYSVTGAYFRKELKHMFTYKRNVSTSKYRCTAYTLSTQTTTGRNSKFPQLLKLNRTLADTSFDTS